MDPDEYTEMVAWVRDVIEAERDAAKGTDDGPSIDMDAEDWQRLIGR